MFREQHPQRKKFDRLVSAEYLGKLPPRFEETVRRIGYDIFFIPAPYKDFARHLSQHTVTYLMTEQGRGKAVVHVEQGNEYCKIMVGIREDTIRLIVFRYLRDPNASAVLVCAETIIEWCELVERAFFEWLNLGGRGIVV